MISSECCWAILQEYWRFDSASLIRREKGKKKTEKCLDANIMSIREFMNEALSLSDVCQSSYTENYTPLRTYNLQTIGENILECNLWKGLSLQTLI